MAYRDKAKDGGLDGIYVLQAGCESRLWQLKFSGTTVFRPYPCPHPDKQQGFMPGRLSTTRCDFSDFADIAEGVAFNGQHRKLTYISEYPGMQDVDESPSKKFFRVISAAVKNRSHLEWIDYIEGAGNNKRDAFIKRPSSYLFLQGYLRLHAGKPVDKHGVVLMVKQSGRQSFEELMSAPNDKYQHPGDNSQVDLSQFFKNPDPTDLTNGHYLVFTPRPATKEAFAGYEVTIGDKAPLDGDMVRQQWTPFDQLLRYMTVEEQMQLLISAFPKPLIYFAFQDTNLLPQEFIAEYMAEQQAAQAQPQVNRGFVPAVTPPTQGQQPRGGGVSAAPNGGVSAAPSGVSAAPKQAQTPAQPQASGELPGYPQGGQAAPADAGLAGVQPSHETEAPQKEAPPAKTYMSEAAAAVADEAMSPEAQDALEQLTGLNQGLQDNAPQS